MILTKVPVIITYNYQTEIRSMKSIQLGDAFDRNGLQHCRSLSKPVLARYRGNQGDRWNFNRWSSWVAPRAERSSSQSDEGVLCLFINQEKEWVIRMLDMKWIRSHQEEVRQAAKAKGMDIRLEHLLAVDEQRRKLLHDV